MDKNKAGKDHCGRESNCFQKGSNKRNCRTRGYGVIFLCTNSLPALTLGWTARLPASDKNWRGRADRINGSFSRHRPLSSLGILCNKSYISIPSLGDSLFNSITIPSLLDYKSDFTKSINPYLLNCSMPLFYHNRAHNSNKIFLIFLCPILCNHHS